MNKLSTLWSNAIAYVALMVGAGLSVAGNVADTFRTRGAATDTLDIILAGAWPILVILTIEMFVSRRWSPRLGFQVLRWFGCLAIGNLAMLVSWLHLHDLLASRGQLSLVAIAGPLAIDGMAIMATGLILSTRGKLASVQPVATPAPVATVQPKPVQVDTFDFPVMDIRSELSLADEAEHYLDRLANDLDPTTTPAVPVQAVRPVAARINPASVPADAAEQIKAWLSTPYTVRPRAGQVDEAIAAQFEVSPRTARGWRDALANA
jgi:hypothetical protein